jgi:anti-sigma-K factor RskA
VNADEIRELAAVYALGALDGEDLARFEALLEAGDDEAAAALREFEASLVALAAESAEAPPASVKAALMDGVGARGAARETVARPRPSPPSRRTWWPVIWAAAMAAGLAAIAVGLSVSVTYQRRLETLTREASALRGDLDRQRTELDRQRALVALVRDPATQIVALAGLEPAPSARARMIWNVREGGLLVAAGLPSAPEGKTYQLWAIAGQSAPVSAGVFDVDARGTGSLQVSPLPGIDKVTVFAVTLEPAGGVPAPSGKMFLAGKS